MHWRDPGRSAQHEEAVVARLRGQLAGIDLEGGGRGCRSCSASDADGAGRRYCRLAPCRRARAAWRASRSSPAAHCAPMPLRSRCGRGRSVAAVYNRYYPQRAQDGFGRVVELYQGSVEPSSRKCRTDACRSDPLNRRSARRHPPGQSRNVYNPFRNSCSSGMR